MRKKAIAVLAIVFVVFSAYAFIIPFPKGASFWIAYAAEVIAIALQFPIFKVAFDGKNDLKSKVLGFPIMRVGYMYLGIQTTISLALIPLGYVPIPAWLSLVLCIIVLGAALACSVSAAAAREEVEKIEAAVKPDTSLMMDLRSRSEKLTNKTGDASLKKQLEALAENIRFSDPVSSPAIAAEEQKLGSVLAELEKAVLSGSEDISQLIIQTQSALDDRNTACRGSKRR